VLFRSARSVGWCTISLVALACASHPAALGAAPAPSFPTSADALSCARSALADAGFQVETRMQDPPGQRSVAAALETDSSVTARVVTDQRVDYVRASAHIRRRPDGDSAATLTVRAGTLATEGSTAAGRPLSSLALRGRDAVVTQCHAAVEQRYPEIS